MTGYRWREDDERMEYPSLERIFLGLRKTEEVIYVQMDFLRR
jgi:hypothetical protein